MNNITPVRLYIFVAAVLLFVVACLVSAQQQAPAVLQANQVPQVNSSCVAIATKPSPQAQKYSFKSCIVAEFGAYLDLGQGKYVEFTNGVVKNNSKCENSTSGQGPMLVLEFACGSLSFSIDHSNDSKTFVKSINGLYDVVNMTDTFSNTTDNFVTTQSGHYYKCNSEQAIPVKSEKLTPVKEYSLVFNNFALEAYRTSQGTDFYQIPEECPLDSQPVSDLVRIGVGVCLIALVAIVLVAYFIGRRRWSERSSYESV